MIYIYYINFNRQDESQIYTDYGFIVSLRKKLNDLGGMFSLGGKGK